MHQKLVLIGADRLDEDGPLSEFAIEARRLGFQVEVILDASRHRQEDKTCKKLASKGIRFLLRREFSTNDLKSFFDNKSVALSVNSQWIFSVSQIEFFSGRLYNYHNADLPLRRGKAAHSWRYLENTPITRLTFHEIVPKIDSGRILVSRRIRDKMVGLDSFYRQIRGKELLAFRVFLRRAGKGHLLVFQRKRRESRYYPPIDSTIQGYINWQWNAKEIVLFCLSFGAPHYGAKTFLDGKQVTIRGAHLARSRTKYHPYQSGLILYVDSDLVLVAAPGRGIVIPRTKISDFAEIKVGKRFQTPYSALEMG